VEQRLCAVYGDALARRLRERDAAAQVVVAAADGEEAPPRDLLRRLGLHGYHAMADGPERLLVLVDTALTAHRELARFQLAERLKTELLGGVSHEFRTPLNVIVGYVDLLRDGAFGACDPATGPVLDKVRGNAAYLLELAEEFLDLSRLEADTTSGRRETVDPIPLLREPDGRRHHPRERRRAGRHLHRHAPGGGGRSGRAGRPLRLRRAASLCRWRHACVAACAK